MEPLVKWKFFAGAVAVVWILLLWRGTPLFPLAAGTVLAACWNHYQRKRA